MILPDLKENNQPIYVLHLQSIIDYALCSMQNIQAKKMNAQNIQSKKFEYF
jgi:hypothetical protein